jgi:hypothetical protein
MSVMDANGKIQLPGGGWWSPYGDTDTEIRKNMKAGSMPNAPDARRIGTPAHLTGSKKSDDALFDMLGSIGALAGEAEEEYKARKRGGTPKPSK